MGNAFPMTSIQRARGTCAGHRGHTENSVSEHRALWVLLSVERHPPPQAPGDLLKPYEIIHSWTPISGLLWARSGWQMSRVYNIRCYGNSFLLTCKSKGMPANLIPAPWNLLKMCGSCGFGWAVCECTRFGKNSKLEITVQVVTLHAVPPLLPSPLSLPSTHFSHTGAGAPSHPHQFHVFCMARSRG